MSVASNYNQVRYIHGYREYLIQEHWVPSVTSVLPEEEYIEPWVKRVGLVEAERIRMETGRIGELGHYNIIDSLAKDLGSIKPIYQDIPDFINDMHPHFEQLQVYENYISMIGFMYNQFLEQWAKPHHFKLIDAEFLTYNLEVGYAGRCDLMMYVDGEVCMGDIKTSSHISNNYYMQLAAYQHGLLSQRYIPKRFFILQFHPYVDELDVLHLKQGYDEPYWQVHEVKPDWPGFVKARQEFKG